MNFSEKYGIPIGNYVMLDGEVCQIIGGIDDPAVIIQDPKGNEHTFVIDSPLFREKVKPVPTLEEQWKE